MDMLFPAIEAHFNSDTALKRLARKMYEGFQGERTKPVLPYVECHLLSSDPTDTFGADIEEHSFQLSAFSKRTDPSQARDMRRALLERFDNCKLPSHRFKTVGVNRSGGSGPLVIDGVWQTVIHYDATIQLVVLSPVVRTT